MATTHETDDAPPIAESIGVVQFRGDPERLQSVLLPPPLDPVADGDTAFAIVGDAVYPERRQADRSVPIEETEFREAAVGMPCRYEGDRYVVNPLMFLDRETESFKRGLTRGIGTVTKTKWHAACEGRRRITTGDSVAGAASHGGDDLFSYAIHIEEETNAADLDDWVFEFLHYRHVSDPLASADATSLANDVTLMDLQSLTVGPAWRGSAELTFGDWRGGVLADLVDEVVQGLHFTMGYEYGGDRVVAGAGDWGDHLG